MRSCQSNKIEIAIATDRAYLPWCATTILSCALAGEPNGIRVHLIYADDLRLEDRDLLTRMADPHGITIEFLPFNEADLIALPSKGPKLGGRLSWARVLLPEILPHLNRVIYLDSDTLVVDQLEDLWNMALDSTPLAAVSNVTNPAMRAHVSSLGIASERDYFNAGVLLADLTKWREEGTATEIMELVRSREQFLWFDQDALNVHFTGRWKHLHPRWNAMNSFWIWPSWAKDVFGQDTLAAAKREPAILHFEGPSLAKPWHFLCPHPWRAKYRSVLSSTPWAGRPLEDRTMATRIIARLPTETWIPTYVRLLQIRRFAGTIHDAVASRIPRRA